MPAGPSKNVMDETHAIVVAKPGSYNFGTPAACKVLASGGFLAGALTPVLGLESDWTGAWKPTWGACGERIDVSKRLRGGGRALSGIFYPCEKTARGEDRTLKIEEYRRGRMRKRAQVDRVRWWEESKVSRMTIWHNSRWNSKMCGSSPPVSDIEVEIVLRESLLTAQFMEWDRAMPCLDWLWDWCARTNRWNMTILNASGYWGKRDFICRTAFLIIWAVRTTFWNSESFRIEVFN